MENNNPAFPEDVLDIDLSLDYKIVDPEEFLNYVYTVNTPNNSLKDIEQSAVNLVKFIEPAYRKLKL